MSSAVRASYVVEEQRQYLSVVLGSLMVEELLQPGFERKEFLSQ